MIKFYCEKFLFLQKFYFGLEILGTETRKNQQYTPQDKWPFKVVVTNSGKVFTSNVSLELIYANRYEHDCNK